MRFGCGVGVGGRGPGSEIAWAFGEELNDRRKAIGVGPCNTTVISAGCVA